MTQFMTRVSLIAKPRRTVTLLFGQPAHEQVVSISHHYLYFTPHTVFAMLRWQGNDHGTTQHQLSIMRAVSAWETATRIPGVDPGAELLLRVPGKDHLRLAKLIDRIIEEKIELDEVSPHYWRTVQNRIIARDLLPEYTRDEHAAYLDRLGIL